MKNSGTPIGTVIAMACATEPVSTPRRRLALLKAKVAADKSARKPASTELAFHLAFVLARERSTDDGLSAPASGSERAHRWRTVKDAAQTASNASPWLIINKAEEPN